MKVPEKPMKKFFEPKLQGDRVMTTFHIPKELWTEFKIIMARESRPAGNAISELIEDYVKTHKNGNPQHDITNFLENEDFVGFPAMAIVFQNKKNYINKNCQSDNRLNKFGKELFGHVCQWYEELKKY